MFASGQEFWRPPQWYNGGTWSGTGITSSSVAAIAANASNIRKTAIGYGESSTILGIGGSDTASHLGQTVDSHSIIARHTWSGDANLDGAVNTVDFTLPATNFNKTGQVWSGGDFNYDGTVNALDFNALATNFGQTLPLSGALPGAALGSLVPEPASLASIGLIAAASIVRRRRRM